MLMEKSVQLCGVRVAFLQKYEQRILCSEALGKMVTI